MTAAHELLALLALLAIPFGSAGWITAGEKRVLREARRYLS